MSNPFREVNEFYIDTWSRLDLSPSPPFLSLSLSLAISGNQIRLTIRGQFFGSAGAGVTIGTDRYMRFSLCLSLA